MSDYLCEELIIEIFTRLPPKSLLRFRSLSKSLCSCISSHGFIQMHTFRSSQKVLLIHINSDDKNKEGEDFYTLHGEDEFGFCLCPRRGCIGITTAIPFPRRTDFRIFGSCNGILCVRTIKGMILWNPSIRRKVRVPECPRRPEPNSRVRWEGTGFGFDPISNDYKIVWITTARDSSSIYAVKTGTWSDIASPKPEVTLVSYEGYLFSGMFHWQVHYPTESQELPLTGYLQKFDLSTHVFGMISMPAPSWHWITTGLTTIQGSLALMSYSREIDDTWIWIRRDSSWSMVFKLNTHQPCVINALELQPQPTNNGDLFLEIYKQGIQVYNCKTGMRSRVADFNATSTLRNLCNCVETLHLLDIVETPSETNQL